MDEVNIILLCSGIVVGILIGCSWHFSDKVSYETCCGMSGYKPVSGIEYI